MKNINIKNINKVLITTLLFISVIVFSNFPSSNSKYLDIKDNWIVYNVNTKQLTGGMLNISYLTSGTPSSNYKNVYFSFNFNKSDNLLSTDNKDIYKITLDNYCKFESVIPSNKTTISNNSAIISLEPTDTSNISVIYSCDVEQSKITQNNKNYIKTFVKIEEAFNNENVYYLYMTGNKSIEYDKYREKYPVPTAVRNGNKLTVPNEVTNKYYEVTSWFDEYISSLFADDDPKKDIYIDRIGKYYSNVYNSNNFDTIGLLDGFIITKNTDNIVFEIDENFTNYALTDYVEGNYLYFLNSTIDETKAMELFKYYLNKYYYVKDSENYNAIVSYINRNGGIKPILDGTKTLNGFNCDVDDKTISLWSSLLSYATPKTQGKKEFNYTSTSAMRGLANSVYKELNGTTYINKNGEEFILPDEIQDKVKTFILNNLQTKNEKFNIYSEIYESNDGKIKVLVRAYGNGVDTNGAELFIIDSSYSYDLEFYTSDISSSDISKVTNVLNSIDSNLTKKVDNNSVVSDIIYDDLISNSSYTTPNGINVSVIKTGDKINIRFNNTPIVGASYSMAPTFANNAVQSVSSSIDRTTITEEVIEDSNDNIEDEQEVDETSESEEEDDEDKSKVVSSDDDEDDDSGVTQENNDDITEDGISGNANDGPENVGSDIANNGNSIDINPDAPLDNST